MTCAESILIRHLDDKTERVTCYRPDDTGHGDDHTARSARYPAVFVRWAALPTGPRLETDTTNPRTRSRT